MRKEKGKVKMKGKGIGVPKRTSRMVRKILCMGAVDVRAKLWILILCCIARAVLVVW